MRHLREQWNLAWSYRVIDPAFQLTVDRKNFAVKIILWSWPTAKIKHAEKNLRGDNQWISVHASPHPQDKCQNDDYIQPAIPGSPDTW